jgi:hypothetical protein
MGNTDITGQHAGGPYMHFENLIPDPLRSGRMTLDQNFNIHVFFTD